MGEFLMAVAVAVILVAVFLFLLMLFRSFKRLDPSAGG
jgi:hypothetical protein